ncbi:hypothetical protein BpHYR1_047218 [Brachionus plicatilis]|uniref:Uncharacterized protein n=1 Tax=Brachionus plicatilis TaxID=10195 RepID=A0A3M7T5I0_BRAPC|nr:hypothetical protein BpHYR1_047218 [Brachionus plicatilis]
MNLELEIHMKDEHGKDLALIKICGNISFLLFINNILKRTTVKINTILFEPQEKCSFKYGITKNSLNHGLSLLIGHYRQEQNPSTLSKINRQSVKYICLTNQGLIYTLQIKNSIDYIISSNNSELSFQNKICICHSLPKILQLILDNFKRNEQNILFELIQAFHFEIIMYYIFPKKFLLLNLCFFLFILFHTRHPVGVYLLNFHKLDYDEILNVILRTMSSTLLKPSSARNVELYNSYDSLNKSEIN